MDDDVLDFIRRRFADNCHWTDGNCYYFALILKERFGGTIYYDTIDGHFVIDINGIVYDYNGAYSTNINNPWYVEWSAFNHYDEAQYERIVRDCIL